MHKFRTMLIITLTNLLICSSLWAQSPEKMSYQAVIRDATNNLVTSHAIGMRVSILQSSVTGIEVYKEIYNPNPQTNANGLVTIEIGSGIPLTGVFANINWTSGPYFIKTETDPSGGTNYTITGTSQLLSVPYALHSKTAESLSGGISETDPLFTNSQAANITASDITNLSNLSGVNSGDQDLSGLASKTALGDSTAQVRSEIPDVSGFLTNFTETDPVYTAWDKDYNDLINKPLIPTVPTNVSTFTNDAGYLTNFTETDPSVPVGTQEGQMQYWNGTAWVTINPPTLSGKVLYFIDNVPQWGPVLSSTDVMNGATGKIWMDRNLGASQVATSSTDAAAYGDLYQWGRAADGHESRTSGTTSTLATSDTPGHGNFITNGSSPYDWRSTQNDNLWQGVDGTNNPCPSGYRLPTGAELEAERLSWSSNNSAGAFASPLKLPVAGFRTSNGSLGNVGLDGTYRSSSVDGTNSQRLYFSSDIAVIVSEVRVLGHSVRCIKD